jgi:hypothetical protein
MFLTTIFIISGFAILSLLVGKRIEENTGRPFFVLNLISKSDHRVREFSHDLTDYYASLKERGNVFVRKQLPLHAKNFYNKSRIYIGERAEYYIGNVRGSKLLKKSDGISEFIKSMAEVEKGTGEINDSVYTIPAEEIK